MNPHQRCVQARVKNRNEPKQVMPNSQYLSRSLEIKVIWTFDTEFPTICNKPCAYITSSLQLNTDDIKYKNIPYVLKHV